MTDPSQARPGGLTVLAVVNFVIAALSLVGAAALGAAMAVPEIRESIEQELRGPVTDVWLGVMLGTGVLIAALLLVSGVGYLRQKRVWGRYVGTLYAIVDLASGAYETTRTGFELGTIISFVYPVLTLVLVNGIFKHDLVR
jgi:hypothetical protein